MTSPAELRTATDSLVEMNEIVLPEDSNARGSIFGGRVLSLIDKCAAISAMRFARQRAVTVSMDRVVFVNEVKVGNFLVLRGKLTAAFGSSMEIEVRVESENPLNGQRKLTTCAFVTMVALDENGRPCPVPKQKFDTDEEREVAEAAVNRRQQRLAERD